MIILFNYKSAKKIHENEFAKNYLILNLNKSNYKYLNFILENMNLKLNITI